MIRKPVHGSIMGLASLYLISFLLTVTGHPATWRHIEHLNVAAELLEDPEWQEMMMWSNDIANEEPLLASELNQTRARAFRSGSEDSQTIGELESVDIDEPNNAKKDDTLGILNLMKIFFSNISEKKFKNIAPCAACKAFVGALSWYIGKRKTADAAIKTFNKLCVRFKLRTPPVCDGLSRSMGGAIWYILRTTKMKPREICSFALTDICGQMREWELIFPPVPKPPRERPVREPIKSSLKVLHISDTHIDPEYKEGTNAKCKEPLCCRVTSGIAEDPALRAGRWGDYRHCDLPKHTIDNMFQHILSTHTDIDYILWTGDLLAHDSWNRTQEGSLDMLRQMVALMNSTFPGIPIFPALGNHESCPPNVFPMPSIKNEFAISWLYDEVDKQWQQWLPNSTSRTLRHGGFYSVLVKPGFRIISLNTNYCNKRNWWLLLNPKDPAKMLQWLIYELQSAEFNDEKVHIIAHIAPADVDCVTVWSHNYYKIVARYESTITAQFFGHEHYDEFKIFHDPDDPKRAVNVAYLGPSVTPIKGLNPGYRIYHIEGDGEHSRRVVLDHETWVMNLDEANASGEPTWYKLYSAKDAYQLTDLMPQNWDNLISKFEENEELFNMYHKHYWKNSSARKTCKAKCKKRLICDLRAWCTLKKRNPRLKTNSKRGNTDGQ